MKVPSCNECNGIGYDKLTSSLLERVHLIKDGIERRYARVLKHEEWDEDEIQQAKFGKNLRSHIVSKNDQLKLVRERLDYFAGIDAFLAEFEAEPRQFVGVFT